MVTNEFKEYAEAALIHTYDRFPVAFDHGEGVHLYDTDGKKYLDFAAGIAVNAFGYHVEEYNEALKNQIDKLLHISNLFYTEPMAAAAHKLVKASGLKRVFFTNSGTEAIEGAIFFPRPEHGRFVGDRKSSLQGSFRPGHRPCGVREIQ